MSNPQIEELNLLHAHICQALSDPKRLQILYALSEEPCRVLFDARAVKAGHAQDNERGNQHWFDGIRR